MVEPAESEAIYREQSCVDMYLVNSLYWWKFRQ